MIRPSYLGLLAALGGAALAAASSCKTNAVCVGGCESSVGGAGASDTTTTNVGGGACVGEQDCPTAGQKCCAHACIDVTADLNNCGACDNVCPDSLVATMDCIDSKCVMGCPQGLVDCNGLASDGCEANPESDPLNCGQCGHVCLFANATPQCAANQCEIVSCDEGFADCDQDPSTGCEINVGTDPNHCNDCDTICQPPDNMEAVCTLGICSHSGCLDGFGDCNISDVDGCEIDLLTDVSNCGTCNHVCDPLPNAEVACVAGACVIGSCDLGWGDCDHSVWSGCETDFATDAHHCGGYNAPCLPLTDGFPACVDSNCVLGGCDPGFDDCDHDASNGCETDLSSNLSNCGTCGNTCPAVAHGTAGCSGYACGIASCDPNYDDCFGGAADGCETSLLTDVRHCGGCGNPCADVDHGTKTCLNGNCAIGSCAPGYKDCNTTLSDGCEIHTDVDLSNCGDCNNGCVAPPHAAATCVSGICGLGACDPGYANCDGSDGTGCERATLTDPDNCGGCGLKCGSGNCVGGQCQCSKNLLLIADDSPSGTTVLANALIGAGFTVTTTAVPSYQYNGTNPSPAGFGSIVLLAGGPTATSYQTDMPVAGQTAILNFVNTQGNGLVLTEWATFQVAAGRWQTLAPLVLLTRSAAYSGQVTYTVDAAFASHPIWNAPYVLPGSFTFASTSNVGTTKVAPFVTRAAGSPQALDAVAVRDAPIGRVVHIAHAGNYASNGWTNANIQKLVANSAAWASRCP